MYVHTYTHTHTHVHGSIHLSLRQHPTSGHRLIIRSDIDVFLRRPDRSRRMRRPRRSDATRNVGDDANATTITAATFTAPAERPRPTTNAIDNRRADLRDSLSDRFFTPSKISRAIEIIFPRRRLSQTALLRVLLSRAGVCTRHHTTRSLISINKCSVPPRMYETVWEGARRSERGWEDRGAGRGRPCSRARADARATFRRCESPGRSDDATRQSSGSIPYRPSDIYRYLEYQRIPKRVHVRGVTIIMLATNWRCAFADYSWHVKSRRLDTGF